MNKKSGKMNNKGFSLVELVVVIVILAILAAVTVPAMTKYIDNQKADECQVNLDSMALYLANERVLNPDAVMADVIAKKGQTVKCSTGISFEAVGRNEVYCTYHHLNSIVVGE